MTGTRRADRRSDVDAGRGGSHAGDPLMEKDYLDRRPKIKESFAQKREREFAYAVPASERLERELQWRRWFPTVEWDSTAFISDSLTVETLLEAFRIFCEDNIRIKVPGKGSVPLILREAQLTTVRGWLTYRMTVSLKARQIGFSTVAAAFALWLVLGWSDRKIIMLSRGEREAISLLTKARYAYRKMPDWVQNRGPRLLDKVSTKMTFANDSVLESLPSASDPARGESAFMVFLDEWAFLPNPEEAWASVEPVTDVGGRVIGLSTANGEGNFFHQIWAGSQEKGFLPAVGVNGFHGIFFPWWALPDRDEEWYARKKAAFIDQPSKLFQEYPSNPEEAFQGSGNPVYSLELLRAMEAVEPLRHVDISSSSPPKVTDGGKWMVWEEPDPKCGYVIGADVSFGLSHGDYSVSYVMNVTTGVIAAMWRGHIEPDEFARILVGAGLWYNNALLVPEVNNHGLTTLKAIQRFGYTNIYRRRTFTKAYDSAGQTLGWLTTNNSKPLMVDELGVWLRDHNVPERQTLQELRTFVRTQKANQISPRFSGSPHDDCVMALGITVQGRKWASENGLDEPKATVPEGSYDWWIKQLESQSKKSERTGLKPGVFSRRR